MAIPANQLPQNAQDAVLNLAKALGVEIEIKSVVEEIGGNEQEVPQKKKRKSKRLPKFIPSEDVKKILAQPNINTKSGLKNRVMLETFYLSGIRVRELVNLSPADIDFVKGKIYVQLGKGGRDRYISIGSRLVKWLTKWNEIRPESAYFFCTSKGGQLDVRQVREMCYRLSKKAGVYIQDGRKRIPVSPHKWRHTYATSLLSKGVNIRQIQKLLGHTSISTTEIYAEIDMDELDSKIKALG